MELVIRMLGAMVVTFVSSRVLFGIFGSRSKQWALSVIGVHLLSLSILIVFVGLLRAYFTSFNLEAAIPYVIPQIVWLVLDLIRLRVR